MHASDVFFKVTLALVCLFLPASSLCAPSQKTALVIGNGAYQSAPLKNPPNDARDMAAALAQIGFEVLLEIDADQRRMKEAIRIFGKHLRAGGVGLFYYAGHGLQVDGRNYLIPIGARIGSRSEVEYEAVDAGRVLGQMHDAANGLNIVILDACRDNPFSRSFRSSGRGLTRMDAPVGSILAYATAPGEVAADGEGRNGLYTTYLLKHMQTPGLPIEQYFKRVRRDVRNASGRIQVPWTESSLIGDFYFKPAAPKASAAEQETPPAPSQPPAVAAIDPAAPGAEVVAREGRFEKLASGVVYDTRTGLEWIAGPDHDTDFYSASQWIKGLKIDGGGWRMPTVEELKGLYQQGIGARNMTPLMETSGWYVWSGKTKVSATAWDFRHNRSYSDPYLHKYASRVRGFAVRSRK